jgi:hypothetical protein
MVIGRRILTTAGLVLLGVGTVTALGALIVRDQIARHQRGLFSSRLVQRFAALGYIAGLAASVEIVQLLRDFVAWEPNSILRGRASLIIDRMERQLGAPGAAAQHEFAG